MHTLRLSIFLSALTLATPSFAARCGGDFNSFVASISAEAQAAGVSQGVIASALGGVTVDQSVLNFDRRQRYTFNKSFEQYVSTRVGDLGAGDRFRQGRYGEIACHPHARDHGA
jgi:membrane-bound lytic murein transglycosylase B